MFGERIEVKRPEQIAVMRQAGSVVGATLDLLRRSVRVGITTRELDALARQHISDFGATSNFDGYGADRHGQGGFAGAICTSVNDEVVHGVPGDRVLAEGDLISIDCGAIVDGWHGDAAITVPVGAASDEHLELIRVTETALWAGIAAASRRGARIGDIGAAIEASIAAAGPYGITDGLTGHGIGTAMHQPPWVPNVRTRSRGARITPGTVLAIEPMVTLGTSDSRTLADDWTIVTTDGSWAAHVEHTVAFTESGPWVLTSEDGGAARLADLGLPFGGR